MARPDGGGSRLPSSRVALAALALALVALPACSSDGDRDTTEGTSTPSSTTSSPSPSPAAGGEPAPLPLARTEVAGTAWRGLIAVVGGLTADGSASNQVDLYDPATNRWRAGPVLPLVLHHAGVATLGDRLWVVGGYSNRSAQPWRAVDRAFSLGPGDDRWREEPSLSAPRAALALASVGDRLIAVGGVPEAGLRTTEVLVLGERSWRRGPDLADGREHLALASSKGRVYAIGGRVGSLESNLRSVESWDPTGAEGWRPEPALNDSRGGTAAAEAGGRPCVAGGEEPTGTIPSVECLADGRWERVATLAVARHGLAVVGLGGRLHVIGGGPTPGLSVGDAHQVVTVG